MTTKINNALNDFIFDEKMQMINGIKSHIGKLYSEDDDAIKRIIDAIDEFASGLEKKTLAIKSKPKRNDSSSDGESTKKKKRKQSFYHYWLGLRLKSFAEEQKTVSNDQKVSKTDRMKKISPEWQVLSKWDNSRWNKDSKEYQEFIKSDEYDKKSFKKEIKYWTDFRSKNLESFLKMKDDYDEKSSASESEVQEKSSKSSSTKKKKDDNIASTSKGVTNHQLNDNVNSDDDSDDDSDDEDSNLLTKVKIINQDNSDDEEEILSPQTNNDEEDDEDDEDDEDEEEDDEEDYNPTLAALGQNIDSDSDSDDE